MIFWIKQEKDGKIVRLEDNSWSHSIYVSSDNKHDLASIAKDKRISSFIKRYEFVKKYEKIIDKTKSEVLKLTLTDRSEEHTSELQSRQYLVCRLLLEKKQQLPRLDPASDPPAQFQAPPLPAALIVRGRYDQAAVGHGRQHEIGRSHV